LRHFPDSASRHHNGRWPDGVRVNGHYFNPVFLILSCPPPLLSSKLIIVLSFLLRQPEAAEKTIENTENLGGKEYSMANWFVSSWSSLKRGADRFLFTEDYKFSLQETLSVAKATSVSPHVTNFIAVIGSLSAGAPLKDGSWPWGMLVGIVIAISIFGEYRRDARTARISKEKRRLHQQPVKDLVLTLIDTTQGTSDALSIEEKRPRQESLASARRAILSTVQQSIGPENGVRVNFFEVTCLDPPTLEASGHGHVGRDNHRSTRVFTSEDETLQLALYRNQGRFVEDA